MSLFSDGLAFGYGAVEDVAGETVTYIYVDGTVQTGVIAVPAQHETNQTSPAGNIIVVSRGADWLVRKDRLRHEPRRGDAILTADNRRYIAMPVNNGPVWQWSDTGETHYRIHMAKE